MDFVFFSYVDGDGTSIFTHDKGEPPTFSKAGPGFGLRTFIGEVMDAGEKGGRGTGWGILLLKRKGAVPSRMKSVLPPVEYVPYPTACFHHPPDGVCCPRDE